MVCILRIILTLINENEAQYQQVAMTAILHRALFMYKLTLLTNIILINTVC